MEREIKISLFTTATNAIKEQYPLLESIANYCSFADEVIVVDGGSTDGTLEKLASFSKVKVVHLPWPQDKWHWSELPRHINEGFKACTGEVCLKMDLDYLIHEKDFTQLRERLIEMYNND